MSFVPVPTLDWKLMPLFLYKELDPCQVEKTSINAIMKHKKPFDSRPKPYVKAYHVIEVCTKQVFASMDAHIVSYMFDTLHRFHGTWFFSPFFPYSLNRHSTLEVDNQDRSTLDPWEGIQEEHIVVNSAATDGGGRSSHSEQHTRRNPTKIHCNRE
jgi:hypothetical protein